MQGDRGQCVAIALSGGEYANGLEDVVFRKQKTSQQAPQFGLRGARGGFKQIVEHACLRVQHLVLVLGEVVYVHIVPWLDSAGGGRLLSCQELDQRGLSGTVRAYQRDPVSSLDHEIDFDEDILWTVALCS